MQNVRSATQANREALEHLHAYGLEPGSTVAELRSNFGMPGNIPLNTNLHGIVMHPVPVFRYDVSIIAGFPPRDGQSKEIDLTKKSLGDPVIVDRRERCRTVFNTFKQENREFINGTQCYYDLQSILYSLKKLEIPEKESAKFDVPVNLLPRQEFEGFAYVRLSIRPVHEDFQINLGPGQRVENDLSRVDYSLQQFLDIMTAQEVLFSEDHITFSAGTSYMKNPEDFGFNPQDGASFNDNSSYLSIGCQKSVHYVEGPPAIRGGNLALVVESKKTPFHLAETLLEKVRKINGGRLPPDGRIPVTRIGKLIEGLFVETIHLDRLQRFQIKGLDEKNATERTFEYQGVTITVNEYFNTRHKKVLEYANLPLVKAWSPTRGQINYVPIELCRVIDNQRVKTNQQTSRQIQEMIKKCAVPPSILRIHNEQVYNSLKLSDSPYLIDAGVGVMTIPHSLKGRQLNAPEFIFGKNRIESINKTNYTWRGSGEYLIAAKCTSWRALALLAHGEQLTEPQFIEVLKRIMAEGYRHGMQFNRPTSHQIKTSSMKTLKEELITAKNAGEDFLFVVHPDNADEIHNYLKFCEQKSGIITQAIRYTTLQKTVGAATLQNIVNKMNIKLGGLNYSLNINSQEAISILNTNTLYIGIAINSPGMSLKGGSAEAGASDSSDTPGGVEGGQRVRAPSAVGFCANVGLKHEFEFIGDVIFQEPLRDEKNKVIGEILKRCVDKYAFANNNRKPVDVMLFRNGCSQGIFERILKYEVPLIRHHLDGIPLTLVVSNKMQNIRFFDTHLKNSRDRVPIPIQNIQPGLVVDHTVTQPALIEFFLNSHRTLQGTARTPKYSVLVNDNKRTLEQLEMIVYQLCYGHQIVFMPTSLPSPVYIANRYAERGRKLYLGWGSDAESGAQRATTSYEEMTEHLRYAGIPELENRRINA
jgi:eukaryotic translation initiation factor 2C